MDGVNRSVVSGQVQFNRKRQTVVLSRVRLIINGTLTLHEECLIVNYDWWHSFVLKDGIYG